VQVGHEVYIYNEQNQALLVTPGNDGDCGGATTTGSTNVGSTGVRAWHTTRAGCQATNVGNVCNGTATSCTNAFSALPRSFLLPSRVRTVVSSGGGVSFGFESPEIRVR
jgi:hypothetical protein